MPVPERTTPIARPSAPPRASGRRGRSAGAGRAAAARGAAQDAAADGHVVFGRDDVDVVRLHPQAVLDLVSTGIAVARARSSGNRLACLGARCCTSTKAMPVSAGSALSSWVKASSPPAEAPTPTIGKVGLSDGSGRPSACGDSGAASSRRRLGGWRLGADFLRGARPIRRSSRDLLGATRRNRERPLERPVRLSPCGDCHREPSAVLGLDGELIAERPLAQGRAVRRAIVRAIRLTIVIDVERWSVHP